MFSTSRKGSLTFVLRAENGHPATTGFCKSRRLRSPSMNQNSLSLMSAPPRLPPNCCCAQSFVFLPARLALAMSPLRYRPNASPCIAFVPDFVTMLTTPDDAKSVASPGNDCVTRNSWIALAGILRTGGPKVSSLTSVPSICVRGSRPFREPIEMERMPLLLAESVFASWF